MTALWTAVHRYAAAHSALASLPLIGLAGCSFGAGLTRQAPCVLLHAHAAAGLAKDAFLAETRAAVPCLCFAAQPPPLPCRPPVAWPMRVGAAVYMSEVDSLLDSAGPTLLGDAPSCPSVLPLAILLQGSCDTCTCSLQATPLACRTAPFVPTTHLQAWQAACEGAVLHRLTCTCALLQASRGLAGRL